LYKNTVRLCYAKGVSMKAREKLMIIISVIACGVSIAVFALVSLGHFIYTPGRTVIPVVGKMYESTVQQVALLEPVPIPAAPTPVASPSVPAPAASTEQAALKDDNAAKKQRELVKDSRKYRSNDKNWSDYSEFRKALSALFGLL
jgi:hypothetical protein